MKQKRFRLQGPFLYLALLLVVLVVVNLLGTPKQNTFETLDYSRVLQLIADDQIANVQISGTTLVARKVGSAIPESEFGSLYDIVTTIDSADQFTSDVNAIYASRLGKEPSQITAGDYQFTRSYKTPEGAAWWVEWLPILVTMLLLFALYFFMIRQQAGGGKGVMNFGRSKARLTDPGKNTVTFQDVAGADEEKEELAEIVEFLKNPKRFTDVGARIPKGVLLVGPPGTGKTLLARAVSGEAGVPFFTISGSDFVEMFVGVGASRVRDLFDQAKKAAPAIVFIDEIDAVGRHRGAGMGGGHDEREQTLNQLLVEMDGFAHNEGVIVMAATNRADILDPALLRPGRFDRQILVNYPDVKGREEILKIHARGKPLAKDVDLSVLARRTPYLTGADLENVMNEGAILTARKNETEISMKTLEDAITKVEVGAEKKSAQVTDKDKRLVAYHEAGHALVMHFIPECDTVHEISIIPRGKGAGGYTMSLPDEEVHYTSSKRLLAIIAGMMGGHCAERLVLGDVTTGSQSDLKRATKIARNMVTEYGMSETLGPIFLGGEHEVFLGRDFSQSRSSFSEDVNRAIDSEVRAILEKCYQRAEMILTEHRQELDMLAGILIEREKVTEKEFYQIMGASEQAAQPNEAPSAREESDRAAEGATVAPETAPDGAPGSVDLFPSGGNDTAQV